MQRILIIAYFFPPLGGVGIQRTLRLVRHLRSVGWEPELLTVGDSAYPYRDEGALALVPDGVAIYRVSAADPERWSAALGMSLPGKATRKILTEWVLPVALVPDRFTLWAKAAARVARVIVAEREFDLVYVSAPPMSVAYHAVKAFRATRTPVCLDFRDLWVANHYSPPLPPTRGLHTRLERFTVQGAARIIGATEGVAEYFEERYPELAPRVSAITNGFDSSLLPARSVLDASKLRLVHAGTIYPGYQLETLLRGLALARQGGCPIELTMIGGMPRKYDTLVQSLGLKDAVCATPRMDHKVALRTIAGSDAVVAFLTGKDDLFVIPVKLYDAMGLGVPVLFVGPDCGEAHAMLAGANMLYGANPNQPETVRVALDALWSDKVNGRIGKKINGAFVAGFDICNQVSRFAEVFESAVSQRA